MADDDVLLTKADVVALTVDELRCELRQRGRVISGLNKTQLQVALLQAIGQKPTTPVTTRSGSQADDTAPSIAPLRPPSVHEQAEASADLDNVADGTTLQQNVPPDQYPWSGLGARPRVFTEENWQLPASNATGRDRTATIAASVRATTQVSGPPAEPVELQLRRMEMEMEIRRMELEERERERQHRLELRRLELDAGLGGTGLASSRPPPFRVDTAIKPIPKFNEDDN